MIQSMPVTNIVVMNNVVYRPVRPCIGLSVKLKIR